MEAIRIIVLAAASSMLLLMIIISSASAGLTEEEAPSSSSSTTTADTAFSAPLERSGFLFKMNYKIGADTIVAGIVDTGSGIIWTKKSELSPAPAMSCPASDGGTIWLNCEGHCTFSREYGGGGPTVIGVMGQAELAFRELAFQKGSSATSDYFVKTPGQINIGSPRIFGCTSSSSTQKNKACKLCARDDGGIVGLNRDKQSLVTQLRLHSFSYCLPHHQHEDKTKADARIKFNEPAAAVSLDGTTKMKLDAKYPVSRTHYAVGLKQIRVGETSEKRKNNIVQVGDCSVKDTHGDTDHGAMLIDSGSAVTLLPKNVFNGVKERVEELLQENEPSEKLIPVLHKDGNQEYSCYSKRRKYPKGGMDSIVLDFCSGDGMEIPPKNYLLLDQKAKDGGEAFCLAFRPHDKDHSILGAYQQQDMHMRFDIEKETVSLSFSKPSGCGQSESQEEENHATM